MLLKCLKNWRFFWCGFYLLWSMTLEIKTKNLISIKVTVIYYMWTCLWKGNLNFSKQKYVVRAWHCFTFIFLKSDLIEGSQILPSASLLKLLLCCFGWSLWRKSGLRQTWSWKRKDCLIAFSDALWCIFFWYYFRTRQMVVS